MPNTTYPDPDVRCLDCEHFEPDPMHVVGGCRAASDAVDAARLEGWPIPNGAIPVLALAPAASCPGLSVSDEYLAMKAEVRSYCDGLRSGGEVE